MIDVHPPHSAVHGIRDFLIHLFTITIGLLIALGLEGCVERAHHRHLVHEAEASLRTEIQNNSSSIATALTEVHKQQDDLKHDVEVLRYIAANKRAPKGTSLTIAFHMRSLADVAWKTAQTTGAFSYMPYPMAQEYADIYSSQDKLNAAELQAVRDSTNSLGPFLGSGKDDEDPTWGEAAEVRSRVEILAGQLFYVEVLLKNLDEEYKKFLSTHPSP